MLAEQAARPDPAGRLGEGDRETVATDPAEEGMVNLHGEAGLQQDRVGAGEGAVALQ